MSLLKSVYSAHILFHILCKNNAKMFQFHCLNTRISICKHCCILHFHLQPGSQLLSGFTLTALCQLLSAAVWSSFRWAQCCQTLWSWLHYQMSQEWNGLLYHFTQRQLSPRHPHTCKRRYMTLLMPPCEMLYISNWDGHESRLSQDHLAALQRHWRGNHKYPLRYAGSK